MRRRIVAVGAVAVVVMGMAACHRDSQTAPEPTPARVTVTATPTPTPAAETTTEPAQWPTVDQTWGLPAAGEGEDAGPVQESNCGLTCPNAPANPDWTTVPVQPAQVTTGPAMPDTTETPEVDGEPVLD